jgi:hypothetical protein
MPIGTRVLGGVIAGLGSGLVQGAKEDILTARQTALEEARARREQEAARLRQQEAEATRAANRETELEKERLRAQFQAERDERTAERQLNLERLRHSLRAKAPAQTAKYELVYGEDGEVVGQRNTITNELKAVPIRKSAEAAKYEPVYDEAGNMIAQRNTVTNELKAVPTLKGQPSQAAPREARDAQTFWNLAVEAAKDEYGVVNWETAAKFLERSGQYDLAEVMRESKGLKKQTEGSDSAEPSGEPAPPVTIQSLPKGTRLEDLPRPTSPEERDRLPKGAYYITPTGQLAIRR